MKALMKRIAVRGPDTGKYWWKVPAREVYCETVRSWFVETLYCHIWLRAFKSKLEGGPT
jgi:hypothetical protein